MGERKGTNKYYPPDFDPRLHRSLDAYHGTHALRERAKKVQQGIIVIRFEMPYNIWCGGCGRHVAMGVRYNAEKKKVGMYYSTPVYEFNMKCHLCDQRYIIRTDPGNFDYTIVSGARRKEQRWDPTENGQIAPEDGETKRRLATDAMYRLEHAKADEERVVETAPRLNALAADSGARGAHDVQLNRLVRAGLRDERKRLAAAAAADADLMARHSLTGGTVQLLPADEADDIGARMLHLGSVAPVDAVRSSRKRRRSSSSQQADAADDDGSRKRSSGGGAFESVQPAEPDELRRRTVKSRRMMGIVIGAGARASSASANCPTASSGLETSPTISSNSSTSPTVSSDSATSPTVSSNSATSPMVSSNSATSQTVPSTEASSTAALSTSLATCSTLLEPTAIPSTKASGEASSIAVANNSEDTVIGLAGLVQYSATPSPASSSASKEEEDGLD